MKHNALILLGTLVLLINTASAAPFSGDITFNGAVNPWSLSDTSIQIINNDGAISASSGDFSPLSSGTLFNGIDIVGMETSPVPGQIPLALGDYTGNPDSIGFLNDFSSFTPPGTFVTHDIRFDLISIDFVDFSITNILINMTLEAVSTGPGFTNDPTQLGFQWEFSSNGSTGSYSATTPIPTLPSSIPSPSILMFFAVAIFAFFFSNKKQSRVIWNT